MITVIGLDLGTSGKSSVCVLQGEKWSIYCPTIEAIQSIASPDLELVLVRYCDHFNPQIIIMEQNGPGSVFASYVERNRPGLPLASIDVSLALPEEYELELWDDIRITNREVLNVRAAMYWALRYAFRDQKIQLWGEDEELIAQLGTLRWDNDQARGDKMYMISKRKLKFKSSELDSEPFSKSPDKADSLALAMLGFVIVAQQDQGSSSATTEVTQEDVVDPQYPGFFELGLISDEA